MRKITIYLLALSGLLASNLAEANVIRQLHCKVIGISDGDTLTCLQDRTQIKVRLQYIDAPESAQPFGQKAKQTLANLTFKKNVWLHISGYDKYQRALAVMFDEQNRNLNLALVEQGMAWAYQKSQPIYQQAEQQARLHRIGLWREPNPINPADWRKNKQNFASNSLQTLPNNSPLTMGNGVNCQVKLSCKQLDKMGGYPLIEHYYRQCGWQSLDGNGDGIPCNKQARKAKRNG